MSLLNKWDKAVKNTKVVKWRESYLATFDNTRLKYTFLAESSINTGDTVQREGNVVVHRPLLLLPENIPQFEGWEFLKDIGADEDEIARFLLIRGISFPSLKYRHETGSLDVVEKPLNKTLDAVMANLNKQSNADTGVVVGPEDCWQLSLMIYVNGLMGRSARRDIERLLD